MGLADYSYRFVLDRFRPVLERIAPVAEVIAPKREIDAIHDFGRVIGQDTLFLSFNPPQHTLTTLRCPTVPVFAWEFDDLPDGAWIEDPRHRWTHVFEHCGRCITHSKAAAEVVRRAMGKDFPVYAIPAPLPRSLELTAPESQRHAIMLTFAGRVTDSKRSASSKRQSLSGSKRGSVDLFLSSPAGQRNRETPPPLRRVEIPTGPVVYTAVFNPRDGRKNWRDLVTGFCVALGDCEAVLILKVFGSFAQRFHAELSAMLRRLEPATARVIAIDALLDDEQYLALALGTTYAVNSSHGEGQCLPLMEYMALGKPPVAPAHTGMLDYIDDRCGFPYQTSNEPASWPQDPTHRIKTSRQRIDMAAFMAALSASFNTAWESPKRYEELSREAALRVRSWAGADAVERRLRSALVSDTAAA